MRYLIAFILLVSPAVRAATNILVDGFTATISSAYSAAADRDTVMIPPGEWLQTAQITISQTKSVNLQGYGTNSTFLISTNTANLFISLNSSTNPILVSDITFIGHTANNNSLLDFGKNVPASTPFVAPVRVTRCHFVVKNRGLVLGYGGGFGVADNCSFINPTDAAGFTSWSPGGNDYHTWTNPVVPIGTTNVVCVEDSLFKNDDNQAGNGFFDGYKGIQEVIRYNVFDGTANNGAHGYDSDTVGPRTGELYRNVFTNNNGHIPSSGGGLIDWRGGTLLWYSNTCYGSISLAGATPLLKYYRGCQGSVNTISNWANIPQVVTWSSNPSAGTGYNLIYSPPYTFRDPLIAGDRQVLRGATLADSISNLVMCINLDPAGSGTAYSSTSTRNNDVKVVAYDSTSITLSNVLDGSAAFSWPAAFQHGVVTVTRYTNSPIAQYPCYSWANTYNGTPFGFGLAFSTDPCNGVNNITNLLQDGRDFFDDTTTNWVGEPVGYTPLAYPHPLRSAVYPVDLTLTFSSSGASPTITTTPDLLNGGTSLSGSGTRTYLLGARVTNSVPATVGSTTFNRWVLNGSTYSTDTTMVMTNDASSTLEAVYDSNYVPSKPLFRRRR